MRVSYVHKRLQNHRGVWNRAQQLPLWASPVPCGDAIFPCPLNPLTNEPLDLARVPDEAVGAQDVLYDTFPQANYAYDTIQFAANRRFAGRFFIQGSFDSDGLTSSTKPLPRIKKAFTSNIEAPG